MAERQVHKQSRIGLSTFTVCGKGLYMPRFEVQACKTWRGIPIAKRCKNCLRIERTQRRRPRECLRHSYYSYSHSARRS